MSAYPDSSSLCGSKANACAMLEEERAPSLAQFLMRRLVVEDFEEADGAPVSQDVEETHKFVMKSARCGQDQGQESHVAML